MEEKDLYVKIELWNYNSNVHERLFLYIIIKLFLGCFLQKVWLQIDLYYCTTVCQTFALFRRDKSVANAVILNTSFQYFCFLKFSFSFFSYIPTISTNIEYVSLYKFSARISSAFVEHIFGLTMSCLCFIRCLTPICLLCRW